MPRVSSADRTLKEKLSASMYLASLGSQALVPAFLLGPLACLSSIRRRLLPSRWASGVARRGRTEAPLPLGVSQVSSSLRRRQGRGPRPAPARQPPAPPKPYLSAPGDDRGPRSGRGRSPWPRAAAARLLCPRERRGWFSVPGKSQPVYPEESCADLMSGVTL